MQEQTPITSRRAVTQPWSDEELRLLKRYANRTLRHADVPTLFPGRTIGSVKVKLSKIRCELGVEKRKGRLVKRVQATTMLKRDDPGYPSNYPERAAQAAAASNAAFLAALSLAIAA